MSSLLIRTGFIFGVDDSSLADTRAETRKSVLSRNLGGVSRGEYSGGYCYCGFEGGRGKFIWECSRVVSSCGNNWNLGHGFKHWDKVHLTLLAVRSSTRIEISFVRSLNLVRCLINFLSVKSFEWFDLKRKLSSNANRTYSAILVNFFFLKRNFSNKWIIIQIFNDGLEIEYYEEVKFRITRLAPSSPRALSVQLLRIDTIHSPSQRLRTFSIRFVSHTDVNDNDDYDDTYINKIVIFIHYHRYPRTRSILEESSVWKMRYLKIECGSRWEERFFLLFFSRQSFRVEMFSYLSEHVNIVRMHFWAMFQ